MASMTSVILAATAHQLHISHKTQAETRGWRNERPWSTHG
jgi:hypothetical protein